MKKDKLVTFFDVPNRKLDSQYGFDERKADGSGSDNRVTFAVWCEKECNRINASGNRSTHIVQDAKGRIAISN